jgi:hypothetical protein
MKQLGKTAQWSQGNASNPATGSPWNDGELLCLLRLLVELAEAAKGTRYCDPRYQDAEGLAASVLFHGLSAAYLNRSTKLSDFPGGGIDFFAPGSVVVLARAALESFLVFHLIFIHPESEEERELRYFSWKLGGHLERRDLPFSSDEARKAKSEDEKKIVELEIRIRSNPLWIRLAECHQRQFIKGEWREDLSSNKSRRLSWTEIGQMANLSRLICKHYYQYACGWAHSGSLTAVERENR